MNDPFRELALAFAQGKADRRDVGRVLDHALDVVDAARRLSTAEAMDWTSVPAEAAWSRLRRSIAVVDALKDEIK